MKGKIFTVAEANRTLPLVRRIAADCVDRDRERRALAARYKVLYAKTEPTPDDVEEMRALESQISALRVELASLADEFEAIGCFLKSSQDGQVVWYGELDGRIVFLSWCHGEDELGHYHALDAGFGSRQPLTATCALGDER